MKIIVLVYAVLWVVMLVGWVANIYKLFNCNLALTEFTVLEILRVVGIFVAPLGSVLGYF